MYCGHQCNHPQGNVTKFRHSFRQFYDAILDAAAPSLEAWRAGNRQDMRMRLRVATCLVPVASDFQVREKYYDMLLSTIPKEIQPRLGHGNVRTLVTDLTQMSYFDPK